METQYRTLALRCDTKQRFDEVKPYESMSADEFIDELLDLWEGTVDD